MSKDRLYTEKEISTILKRAGERQADQGDKETTGLSLEEIQQIAQEVGLDPGIIAAVAAELDHKEKEGSALSKLWVPEKLEAERVVAGTVTEEHWPEIVSTIESTLGVAGASGQVGRMLEWTYTSKTMQHKITCTPGEGQTRIRIFTNFSRLARVWMIPFSLYTLFLGFVFPFNAGLPALASVGIGLAASLLVYMLIRFGFTGYALRKERTLNKLLARIEKILPEEAAPLDHTSHSVAQPRLVIPEEGDRSDEASRAGQQRRKVN